MAIKSELKKTMSEATAAVGETKKALCALEQGSADEALKALEVATGKLELILARDAGLALAPVDVTAVTHDLVADLATVEGAIEAAEDYLEDGRVQRARSLLSNLASEIVLRTTNIPLAAYRDAIKAVTPLIDQGKVDTARNALQAALNTLVVPTEDIIPLPVVRAEIQIENAEARAEGEERAGGEDARLAELLKEARRQLKMAEVLGYGKKESFQPMYTQLDEIAAKAAAGKGREGWFDRIKEQNSQLI
jgi:hypothetical protein